MAWLYAFIKMKDNFDQNRRRFLKTFAFSAAYSSLLGKTWSEIFAAEIRPRATSTTGILKLKVSTFPALLSESGSVRLAINPLRGDLMPDGQFYPVAKKAGPPLAMSRTGISWIPCACWTMATWKFR